MISLATTSIKIYQMHLLTRRIYNYFFNQCFTHIYKPPSPIYSDLLSPFLTLYFPPFTISKLCIQLHYLYVACSKLCANVALKIDPNTIMITQVTYLHLSGVVTLNISQFSTKFPMQVITTKAQNCTTSSMWQHVKERLMKTHFKYAI